MVGRLGPLFVVEAPDLRNLRHDLLVGLGIHEILTALRSLHLKSVLLRANFLRSLLVLLDGVF